MKYVYYVFGSIAVAIGIGMMAFWTYLLFTDPPSEIASSPFLLKKLFIVVAGYVTCSVFLYFGSKMVRKAKADEFRERPPVESNHVTYKGLHRDIEELSPRLGKYTPGRLILSAILGAGFVGGFLRYKGVDALEEFGINGYIFGALLGIAAFIPLEIISRMRNKDTEGALELKGIDILFVLAYVVCLVSLLMWFISM